eukprot:CAMPEP_0172297234 /NCGR_PEP_ID=MMETSP1058-20130122/332_1 /TAXON_ID=83371 /ORGANISM="Detonula confervacea, Strain CCMP 353" /LENGTH=217 /DNA_ID=CAMNT_0013006359 /DNA_START=416 /DNA_END=1069 /DNA_ORIENTATION=-
MISPRAKNDEAASDPVVVSFPDLPSSVSPKNNTNLVTMKKERHHSCVVPTTNLNFINALPMPQPATTSAPISLPRSHIHRTPSEIRLESLTLRAEHEDVRMYSRLLCGMKEQIRHRSFASGDDGVHPLSRKSLQGIVNTKLVNDQELEEENLHDGDSDDGGWDISYIPVDEENEKCSMGALVDAPPSSQGLKDSLSKLSDDTGEVDQEDDNVFSMDL